MSDLGDRAGERIVQIVREATVIPRSQWLNVWGPPLVTLIVMVVGGVITVSVITGQYLGQLDSLRQTVNDLGARSTNVENIARNTQSEVGQLNIKMDNLKNKIEEERQDRLNDERHHRIDSPLDWRKQQPTAPAR